MKSMPTLASAVASLAVAQAQYVNFEIEKRQHPSQLRRRADDSVQENVDNNVDMGGYFATVQIGDPPQKLSLQLDTGSSDVWVPYSKSSACKQVTATNPGCVVGSYDPDKSDTYEEFSQGGFQIKYQDEDFAEGDYIRDQLEIGGATVQNLTMGLGLKTNIPYGLIGVGYAANEAYRSVSDETYPNLPVVMQQEGVIKSVAYSLWLNDLEANKGNILFGAIDTKKYMGDLLKLKILEDPDAQEFVHFMVELTSLEATSSTGTDSLTYSDRIAVVLDSGTTLSYLPSDLAEQIWEEAGAVQIQVPQQGKIPLIPCDYANHEGYFSFGFGGEGGPRINVTLDELVLPTGDGPQPTFDTGPYKGMEACEFGIQAQEESPYLLGDTFLRSAYVVYDLMNNEIGMAPTDFNSTDSNIVAFKSKGAPIPSATAAPNDGDSPGFQNVGSSGKQSAAEGFQKSSGGGDGKNDNGSKNSDDDDEDSAAPSLRTGFAAAIVTASSVLLGLML